MVEVTNFLLRWLHLCNLIRDRAEIQNLPTYNPIGHPHPSSSQHVTGGVDNHMQQPQMPPYSYRTTSSGPASLPTTTEAKAYHHQQQPHGGANTERGGNHHSQHQHQHQHPHLDDLTQYKHRCLHKLSQYPPGRCRLFVLDSLRLEIVHQLAERWKDADEIIQTLGHGNDRGADGGRRGRGFVLRKRSSSLDDDGVVEEYEHEEDEEDGLLLDADLEIIDLFPGIERLLRDDDEEGLLDDMGGEGGTESAATAGMTSTQLKQQGQQNKATNQHGDDDPIKLLTSARRLLLEAREYLPQLVSTVLHSPKALTPDLIDPISSLRKLLISRCLQDPDLGIELCWLLEAEVGRNWKRLFEDRMVTGQRLIVVAPADRAAVLAQIGYEKWMAFDLLQSAEQATAYGYPEPASRHHHHYPEQQQQQQHNFDSSTGGGMDDGMDDYMPPPLPASLSTRRCSHYGDTMHFVDRLTQVSLNMRQVPTVKRNAYLQENLHELNRRLRRRMYERGDVSLDVEDLRGPHDGPHVEDVTSDMLKYSVHFPLEPKSVTWPGSDDDFSSPTTTSTTTSTDNANKKKGVMRVLQIIPSECRILSSRERCSFMVQLEVVETGLEGNDARLYASGVRGLGITLEEVMGVTLGSGRDGGRERMKEEEMEEFGRYRIPVELLAKPTPVVGGEGGEDDDDNGSDGGRVESLDDVVVDDGTIPLSVPTSRLRALGANMKEKDEDNMTGIRSDKVDDSNEENKDESEDNDHPIFSTSRGGWQGDRDNSGMYFPPGGVGGGDPMDMSSSTGYGYNPSPYDMVREEELEQLHYQMNRLKEEQRLRQHQQEQEQLQHRQQQAPQGTGEVGHHRPLGPSQTPALTRSTALLDRIFGIPFAQKCSQIRQTSPYGKIQGWKLASFIVKAGEDIRRDALVMQVISKLNGWFQDELPPEKQPYLRPYTIMCVGGDAGLLECLVDTKSVDEVKKETDGFTTLRDFFERAYGPPLLSTSTTATSGAGPMGAPGGGPMAPGGGIPFVQQPPSSSSHQQRPPLPHLQPPNTANDETISFEQAQDNFLRSLVGYSLVCYILQIKDRHNANILLDRYGHLIHIDFGYVLGDTPKMGKVPIFSERAPFKLTQEFWDVINGRSVHVFVKFCLLFESAFECASAHTDEIVSLIEAALLNLTRNTNLARSMAEGVRVRLSMRGKAGSREQKTFIRDLVNAALTSWGTSTYDWLQLRMNGYQ